MFNMVQVVLALVIVHALSMGVVAEEMTPPRAARMRSFGPYGRRKSTESFVSSSSSSSSSSDYNFPSDDQNQRRDNHRFVSSNDNNQQNLYRNHNLGNRIPNNQDNYHNIQNLHSNHNVGTRNNYNDYSMTNGNSNLGHSSTFNGFGFEVDQSNLMSSGGNVNQDVLNNINHLNSNQIELLTRLYQTNPDEFRRRVGAGEFSDIIDWDVGIHRSGGVGGILRGSGGGRMSLDVYSFLALGMFTAFIAYVVYFFITLSANGDGGGGTRRLDLSPRKAATIMDIISDITNAFDRWAIFDDLPESLPELDILKIFQNS